MVGAKWMTLHARILLFNNMSTCLYFSSWSFTCILNYVFPHCPTNTATDFRYKRQGSTKSASDWLNRLQPYVHEWATATTRVWQCDVHFQHDQFDAYLQSYMRATRLYLIPASAPEDLQSVSTSQMYPLESTAGFRHHAVSVLCLVQISCC